MFEDIVKNIDKQSDIKLRKDGISLRMDKHPNPLSISEKEFKYITDIIIRYNLKSGFELATAFGISSLAAALGFRPTDGSLITVDSYIEEKHNSCTKYFNNTVLPRRIDDATPDGLVVAKKLHEIYETEPLVSCHIGSSPVDIPNIVFFRHFDYVFIDAEHTDIALMTDLSVISPFLSKEYVLLIHDYHCFSDIVNKFCDRLFGKHPKIIWDKGFKTEHYNLAIINTIED